MVLVEVASWSTATPPQTVHFIEAWEGLGSGFEEFFGVGVVEREEEIQGVKSF